MPPSDFSAFASGLITCWPVGSGAAFTSSAMVRPVTVFSLPCRRRASSRRLPTTAMPPASYISGAV